MKILIHGYYGAGNLGDDAILEAMIDSIAHKHPNTSFTVISKELYPPYSGSHMVESVDIDNQPEIKKKLSQSDIVIIGGGGILQDYSGWQKEKITGKKARGMNYYGQIIELAVQYHKPIYFYAIGIGPLSSPKSQKLAYQLLSTAKKITVRDTTSLLFFRGNLNKFQVIKTADPALNLKTVPQNKAINFLRQEKIPENKTLVGICLRPWFFKDNDKEKLMSQIAQVGNRLIKKENAHLILLPFSRYHGDLTMMKQLASLLPIEHHTIIQHHYSPKEMKGLLGQLNLMIGMRLHALILASSMGIPVIGLSYDPKVKLFLQEIGQQKYSYPLKRLNSTVLYNSSVKLIRDANSEKKEILKKIRGLQDLEKENLNFLLR